MGNFNDFNKIRDVNATNITPQDLSWDDLKMILDNSFDEIYVIDSNGKIIYVNNVSTLHYGFMADELIGQNYLYLQEKQCCTPPLVPIIMKEKKTITMEQKTRTGKIITVTATPIFNQHGEVRMTIMNSRDISNIITLKNTLELKHKKQKQYKEAMLHYQSEKGNMVAESKAMQMCLSLGKRVARFDTGILILGDSGVGKSLLAHYIHNESKRKNEPFITINCASIPKELLESELFGYVKGAFSGAQTKGKEGLAAVANKGTLFLDEIGEMPYNVQAKILQLVQEHSFIPLGGVKETGVDIKIIAATNQNLDKLVEQGLFRKDLYYRLDTIKIEIPSL
ncbi:MAG: sigma 54-interacting transcriptional regulator, partial [Clostridiales bacterium]